MRDGFCDTAFRRAPVVGCTALLGCGPRDPTACHSRVTRSAKYTLSSDWYGTSCLLASALRSASKPAGKRNEMVSVDGFNVQIDTVRF